MAFLVEKGTFTKRTTTGTDVISHSMSDTPDILIFWTTAQTATGFDAHYIYSMGYSDATRHKAVSMCSEDVQTMSDTGRRFSTGKCIHIFTSNGATEAEADISAVSSTNFTVNWTTNGGGADIIHYMVFSGSDLTVSEVGEFTANTTTGNQTISHTNSPTDGYDIYMFLTARVVNNTIASGAEVGIGFATGAANEAAMAVVSEHNRGTSDTFRFQSTSRCIVEEIVTSGAVDAEAEFVSKATANFTINWVDAPANADLIAFMGIKGGQHHVNSFAERSGTGTQDITDAGFTTKGYMLASFCLPANASVQANNKISFGGTDGTTEGVLSARDQDAVGTTAADTNESSADVIRVINTLSDTIGDEANHSALLSNGFRINWTAQDALNEIFYWTFGDDVGAPTRRRFPQKPTNLRY